MASPTRWTWVWVNSGSWWWTGRPGVLRFMELQRVRHDWVTELNWTELIHFWKGHNAGKVAFSYHFIKVICRTNADIDLLTEVVTVRFLYCKVTLFTPFPYYSIWKEATLCSLYRRIKELFSSSFRSYYLHEWYKILDSTFIFLSFFYCIFVLVWSQIFILWVLIKFCLFYCSNCFSFGHWYLFHLAPISLLHTPTIVSACYFTSLFPGTISCSRILLYISCPILEQSFLHGALVPFTGAWYWKSKSQYLGVLIAMVFFTEFWGFSF